MGCIFELKVTMVIRGECALDNFFTFLYYLKISPGKLLNLWQKFHAQEASSSHADCPLPWTFLTSYLTEAYIKIMYSFICLFIHSFIHYSIIETKVINNKIKEYFDLTFFSSMAFCHGYSNYNSDFKFIWSYIFLLSEMCFIKHSFFVFVSGIFFVLPCIESYTKVDLRTVSFDVPPQEVGYSVCIL